MAKKQYISKSGNTYEGYRLQQKVSKSRERRIREDKYEVCPKCGINILEEGFDICDECFENQNY